MSKPTKPMSLDDSVLRTLFPRSASRSEKRKVEIAESAIAAYVRYGPEGASYERIAGLCGVSRTLIIHYFPEREGLFEFSVQYIRALFQEMAVEALRKETSPRGMLTAYVRATFRWLKERETHAHLWVYFLFQCGIDRKRRELHSKMVEMGHRRLVGLLQAGKASGDFRVKEVSRAAKLIQVVITGALVTAGTENLSLSYEELERAAVDQCLRLAGASERLPVVRKK